MKIRVGSIEKPVNSQDTFDGKLFCTIKVNDSRFVTKKLKTEEVILGLKEEYIQGVMVLADEWLFDPERMVDFLAEAHTNGLEVGLISKDINEVFKAIGKKVLRPYFNNIKDLKKAMMAEHDRDLDMLVGMEHVKFKLDGEFYILQDKEAVKITKKDVYKIDLEGKVSK